MANPYDLPFRFGADLLKFFQGISREPHLIDKTIDWVAGQVMELFSGHRLAVWLFNPLVLQWELKTTRGLDPERYQNVTKTAEHLRYLEALKATMAPIFTSFDNPAGAPMRPWAVSEGVTDFWALPLATDQGTVMGMLCLYWDQPPEPDSDLVVRWENIADTMSLVIQWAMTIDEHHQEQMAVSTLLDLTGMAAAHSRNNRLVYANEPFLELWNLSRDDLGLEVPDLVEKMSGRVMEGAEAMQEALVDDSVVIDRVLELATVPPRYVRYRSQPMDARTGDGIGRMAVFSDVTEEFQVRRERDAFLSLIGHEFKTPITIIDGIVDWLTQQGAELGSEVAANLHTLQNESWRLSRLLQEILTATQLQDADWVPGLELVDLVALTRSEIGFRQQINATRVWKYQGPTTLMVCGNRDALALVIQALLSNANRFSRLLFPIEVDIVRRTTHVELMVQDRGPGVSPEMVPGLFTHIPNPTHRTPSGGMGLGLYVARKILDRLGGDILYRPRDEGGSVFTVRISVAGTAN